ncbi:MAG: sigma-54 dependent transcriptional regulator [Desulfomonilia bacterium]|jgi:DNA-binding NtrC family response regulator|nr:sigma-54 dependent transcriptional regulator [Desulfomonilia bacterium]
MIRKAKIIVLDDEPNIVEVILARLDALGFSARGFTAAAQALNALKSDSFHVLLTDLKMPDMDGMEVLEQARQIDPDIEVIIFTAYGSIEGAVEAMKQGAHDYLVKPFEPIELIAKIEAAIEKRELKQRVRYLEQEIEDQIEYHIYAESPGMKKVLALAKQAAKSDATVLVLGESGTGKELIAKMLHYESDRRDKKYVIMDCGATPASLIEAELFGYTKGAFTGAIRDKRGIIEEADNGTLFLDEIGNISPEMQTRMLRVLETGEFRPVGQVDQKKVDIRFIAATNVDLRQKVKEGDFREDLYYRLKVITIEIPPLRERKEDIPGLAQIFLTEFCNRAGKKITGFSKDAVDLLMDHRWPGNVRELKNVIESSVVLCRDEVITSGSIYLHDLLVGRDENKDELNPLEAQERAMVVDALRKAKWVQKDAADILGISRRVMHYKIKKFKIQADKKLA